MHFSLECMRLFVYLCVCVYGFIYVTHIQKSMFKYEFVFTYLRVCLWHECEGQKITNFSHSAMCVPELGSSLADLVVLVFAWKAILQAKEDSKILFDLWLRSYNVISYVQMFQFPLYFIICLCNSLFTHSCSLAAPTELKELQSSTYWHQHSLQCMLSN